MIIDVVRGDVMDSTHGHIVFASNTNGYQTEGFAEFVARYYWPELASIGKRELGEVVSYQYGVGVTFHALICHELRPGGWSEAHAHITACLDAIPLPDNQTVAAVLMGSGHIGRDTGADIAAILGGMARARRPVAVYALNML